jgi:hypothetical protein
LLFVVLLRVFSLPITYLVRINPPTQKKIKKEKKGKIFVHNADILSTVLTEGGKTTRAPSQGRDYEWLVCVSCSKK